VLTIRDFPPEGGPRALRDELTRDRSALEHQLGKRKEAKLLKADARRNNMHQRKAAFLARIERECALMIEEQEDL
jgi:hypothetical protein